MIKREEPSLDKQVDGGTSGQDGEHRRGVRQRGQVPFWLCGVAGVCGTTRYGYLGGRWLRRPGALAWGEVYLVDWL